MPRRHRREKPEDDGLDLERLTAGFRRTEVKRGRRYTVQPMPAKNALKTYLCPGCQLEVAPGIAHLVVWREDGLMGEAHDLADRRHWHSHCWRIA